MDEITELNIKNFEKCSNIWNMEKNKELKDRFYKELLSSFNKSSTGISDVGINLTKLAKNKKLSNIVGRDKEIEQIIEIIARKKNVPLTIYFIPLAVACIIAVLVVMQPDLGSAFIILLITFGIFISVPAIRAVNEGKTLFKSGVTRIETGDSNCKFALGHISLEIRAVEVITQLHGVRVVPAVNAERKVVAPLGVFVKAVTVHEKRVGNSLYFIAAAVIDVRGVIRHLICKLYPYAHIRRRAGYLRHEARIRRIFHFSLLLRKTRNRKGEAEKQKDGYN